MTIHSASEHDTHDHEEKSLGVTALMNLLGAAPMRYRRDGVLYQVRPATVPGLLHLHVVRESDGLVLPAQKLITDDSLEDYEPVIDEPVVETSEITA